MARTRSAYAYRSHFFVHARQCWKKQYGRQAMTWRIGIKKLASILASVGASRFPSRATGVEGCSWLERLRDMALNQSHRGGCCMACP